jgi:hypothetical protein
MNQDRFDEDAKECIRESVFANYEESFEVIKRISTALRQVAKEEREKAIEDAISRLEEIEKKVFRQPVNLFEFSKAILRMKEKGNG